MDRQFHQMYEKLQFEVQASIKKTAKSLESDLTYKMNQGSVDIETVRNMISDKVDRIEFLQSLDLKSSKKDLSTSIKSIETIHKQLKNIMSIVIEGLQHSVEMFQNTPESERIRYEKRLTIVKEAKKVDKWISIFDPNKNNFEFEVHPNKLPQLKISDQMESFSDPIYQIAVLKVILLISQFKLESS